MSEYVLSFQLFSARKFPPIETQLEKLRELGYAGVEPYPGIYESDPDAFLAKVRKAGLTIPSLVSSVDFIDENRDELLRIARLFGTQKVVLSYLAPDERPVDEAGWRAFGARLNEHAEAAQAAGLSLNWHNHAFECIALDDGSRPIDAILEAPALGWEADIGWLTRAHCDVPEELSRYASKISLVHMKDMASDDPAVAGGWADVGSGVVDWNVVWPAVKATGAKLLVVEHDDPPDWYDCAKNSIAFLKTLT
ncbi:MAG: sugar phosphate isomerase/epimerase [Bauldia sp.]|nr:sugar phosphate isomerase/epimerase [Bauldia sp.]